MSKRYKFDVEWCYSGDDGNVTVHAKGTISPGYAACFYLPNGDPGYPEEPAEVDYDELGCWDEEGEPTTFDDSQYGDLDEYILDVTPDPADRTEEDY